MAEKLVGDMSRTDALDVVTEGLAALRGEAATQEIETTLGRLAHTALVAVADADAVSVTQLEGGMPRTVASTDDAVNALDECQYAAGRGPCLQAATSLRPVRVVVGAERDRFPEFITAAEDVGVRASLSVPVLFDDCDPTELVGAFNVYSYRSEAFDPFDEQLLRLLTTAASAAITNARGWRHASTYAEQLATALVSRAEIDQAKGVLMAVHGFTSDQAFRHLKQISQRTNTKLNQVAHSFMQGCITDRPSKPEPGAVASGCRV
jgi:GAF domain-containing protein